MSAQAGTERREGLAALRAPFADDQVEKLVKRWKDKETGETKQIELDYVGHAKVTERLLDVDPAWTWEPLAFTPEGLPCFELDDKERPVGLWIRLTVCGVTRLGYGSVDAGKPEPVKELIGDAIRNAAMRFGVALDLWMKHSDADQATSSTRGRRGSATGNPAGGGRASQAQIGKIAAVAREKEVEMDVVRRIAFKKWPSCEGHLSKLSGGRQGEASALIDLLEGDSATLDRAVAWAQDVRLNEEPAPPPES